MTAAGIHTVHELADLLYALIYQAGQLDAARGQLTDTPWYQTDAGQAFAQAYGPASAGWEKQKAVSDAFVAGFPQTSGVGGWDDRWALDGTGEDVFADTAEAFKPYEALDAMLRSSGAPVLPDYSKTPQPTAPDFDLSAYQLADSAVQRVEQEAADWWAKYEVPIVGGTVVVGLGLLYLLVRAAR